jgi:hypothetical protein
MWARFYFLSLYISLTTYILILSAFNLLLKYSQKRRYVKAKDKYVVAKSIPKPVFLARVGAQVIFLKSMIFQSLLKGAASKTISRGSLSEITRFDTDFIEVLLFSDGC